MQARDVMSPKVVCIEVTQSVFDAAETMLSARINAIPVVDDKGAVVGIVSEAEQRWPLLRVEVLHRVGQLQPGEPIVFVGTASAHRQAAFDACNFIMDYLKTRAPFWKKEDTADGARWVDGRCSDQQAAQRWSKP